MHLRSAARALLLSILIPFLSGCLTRTRVVERRQVNTSNLLSATLAQLVERINADAGKIQTLNASVEIATSVGGAKKGKVTEYQQIKGYILVKDPSMLRVFGLFPIVRNRAFDMVSDGKTFRLSIPPLNRFIEGPAGEPAQPSTNTLENLRPSVFFDSLLLHEIGPDDIPVLEQGTEIIPDANNKKKSWEIPNYIVRVIRHDGNSWYTQRIITFARTDLRPYRQMIYDRNGAVATEATYENFSDFSGISFPTEIKINRPKEEYSIDLTIDKIDINKPLTENQFVLEQPQGSQLKVLQ